MKPRLILLLAVLGYIIIAYLIFRHITKNKSKTKVMFTESQMDEAGDAVDSLLNTLGIKKHSDLFDIDED